MVRTNGDSERKAKVSETEEKVQVAADNTIYSILDFASFHHLLLLPQTNNIKNAELCLRFYWVNPKVTTQVMTSLEHFHLQSEPSRKSNLTKSRFGD